MKKIVKDALVLFAITLVAGVVLGAVYTITKEPIAVAQAEAQAQAYRAVFANAADFVSDDALQAAVTDADNLLKEAGFDGVSITDALYAADADGKPIGAVLTVGGKGYGGTIQFTMGITCEHTISGISILSHSETAGLGAKCTDERFYGQFAGKPAETLQVVKTGATDAQDIDAISGATITSKAVTKAVNAGIWFVAEHMQIGGAAA